MYFKRNSTYLVLIMLLSLLPSCMGSTGKPPRPVRAGATDLIIAIGGGEDCGPGPCLDEMRLVTELRVLPPVIDSVAAAGISVGIVTPTISEGTPPWAHTLLPLSRDPSRVNADLSTAPIKALTLLHLGALLDQATIELVRSPGCRSRGLEADQKRVLLLVNETPLLPYGPDYIDYNLQLGGRAAKRAAQAKIKIFVVGFAPLEDLVSAELRNIAAVTDGEYRAVSNEGELSQALAAFAADWSRK